jgi:hypothetical protein
MSVTTSKTGAETPETDAPSVGTDIAETTPVSVGRTLTPEEAEEMREAEEAAERAAKEAAAKAARTEALDAFHAASTPEARAEALAVAAPLADVYANDNLSALRAQIVVGTDVWTFTAEIATALANDGNAPGDIAEAMGVAHDIAHGNTMRKRVARLLKGSELYVLAGCPTNRAEHYRAIGNRADNRAMGIYRSALGSNAKADLAKALKAADAAEAEALAAIAAKAAAESAETDAESAETPETPSTPETPETPATGAESAESTPDAETDAETPSTGAESTPSTPSVPRSAGGVPNVVNTPSAPDAPDADDITSPKRIRIMSDVRYVSTVRAVLGDIVNRTSLSDDDRATLRRLLRDAETSPNVLPKPETPVPTAPVVGNGTGSASRAPSARARRGKTGAK